MSEKQKRKSYFWPVVFLTAFVLGAVLWVLWMSNVIQQTRAARDNSGFYVPVSKPVAPAPPNTAPKH